MSQIGDFWGDCGIKTYYLDGDALVRNEDDDETTDLSSRTLLQIEITYNGSFIYGITSKYSFIIIELSEELTINDYYIKIIDRSEYPLFDSIAKMLDGITADKLIPDVDSPEFDRIKAVMRYLDEVADKIMRS